MSNCGICGKPLDILFTDNHRECKKAEYEEWLRIFEPTKPSPSRLEIAAMMFCSGIRFNDRSDYSLESRSEESLKAADALINIERKTRK